MEAEIGRSRSVGRASLSLNISSPPLPSELRFDLDVYDGPGRLTYGGYEPDVYCNYNGQRAYQGGSP